MKLFEDIIVEGILEIIIPGHHRILFEDLENIKIVGDIIKKGDSWLKSIILSSMSQPIDQMASFCKESNKIIESTNFLARKKRIDLVLT